ncbi:MAG: hypothetical protein RQ736_05465 [Thiogranum sp.]|nr:hypothetical protein [Thiogranum sp.]
MSVDYKGLFEPVRSSHSYPISVALLPAMGQEVEFRDPRIEQIEISNNRMVPSFLTVQRGDSVEFINRDRVFHQIFSLSQDQPLAVQLDRSGALGKDRMAIKLERPGTTHFFCRIHNKSYARVDVVESPHLQTIQPGQTFHFSGIAPGLWKLRLASPAAETRLVDVSALTAPPPLDLTLASHAGGSGIDRIDPGAGAELLYQKQNR